MAPSPKGVSPGGPVQHAAALNHVQGRRCLLSAAHEKIGACCAVPAQEPNYAPEGRTQEALQLAAWKRICEARTATLPKVSVLTQGAGSCRLQNISSGNVLPALKVADIGNNFLQGSIPGRFGAAGITLMSLPCKLNLHVLYTQAHAKSAVPAISLWMVSSPTRMRAVTTA